MINSKDIYDKIREKCQVGDIVNLVYRTDPAREPSPVAVNDREYKIKKFDDEALSLLVSMETPYIKEYVFKTGVTSHALDDVKVISRP